VEEELQDYEGVKRGLKDACFVLIGIYRGFRQIPAKKDQLNQVFKIWQVKLRKEKIGLYKEVYFWRAET
jgi:hypothetical protein